MDSHFYNVDVIWSTGRKGMIGSPELGSGNENCIEVATPPEFPHGIAGIWSPEHLFTASISSCLMTTFLSIAENSKLSFSGFKCKSRGKLEKIDGRYLITEIILQPVITIRDEKDREKAERIIYKSEVACLISNSIKSKISMHPLILTEQKELL